MNIGAMSEITLVRNFTKSLVVLSSANMNWTIFD